MKAFLITALVFALAGPVAIASGTQSGQQPDATCSGIADHSRKQLVEEDQTEAAKKKQADAAKGGVKK